MWIWGDGFIGSLAQWFIGSMVHWLEWNWTQRLNSPSPPVPCQRCHRCQRHALGTWLCHIPLGKALPWSWRIRRARQIHKSTKSTIPLLPNPSREFAALCAIQRFNPPSSSQPAGLAGLRRAGNSTAPPVTFLCKRDASIWRCAKVDFEHRSTNVQS